MASQIIKKRAMSRRSLALWLTACGASNALQGGVPGRRVVTHAAFTPQTPRHAIQLCQAASADAVCGAAQMVPHSESHAEWASPTATVYHGRVGSAKLDESDRVVGQRKATRQAASEASPPP